MTIRFIYCFPFALYFLYNIFQFRKVCGSRNTIKLTLMKIDFGQMFLYTFSMFYLCFFLYQAVKKHVKFIFFIEFDVIILLAMQILYLYDRYYPLYWMSSKIGQQSFGYNLYLNHNAIIIQLNVRDTCFIELDPIQ
jgi:hypothetical protein